MERRNFIQTLAAGSAGAMLGVAQVAGAATKPVPAAAAKPVTDKSRAELAALAQKMSEPVLSNMAAGTLKKNFALEVSPTWDGRDKGVAYLECFGRLIAGIAPWLALADDGTPEGRTRKRLQQMALQSYTNSVDPANPDYLLWKGPGQTLVDSAYFTNALMRAPKALWEPLDATTKQRIIAEIKSLAVEREVGVGNREARRAGGMHGGGKRQQQAAGGGTEFCHPAQHAAAAGGGDRCVGRHLNSLPGNPWGSGRPRTLFSGSSPAQGQSSRYR